MELEILKQDVAEIKATVKSIKKFLEGGIDTATGERQHGLAENQERILVEIYGDAGKQIVGLKQKVAMWEELERRIAWKILKWAIGSGVTVAAAVEAIAHVAKTIK